MSLADAAASTPWSHDPKTIATLVAGAAGWTSAAIAFLNGRTARRQLALASAQDSQRRPNVAVALAEGMYEVGPAWRLYVLSIVLSNRSDRPNAITVANLEIHYKKPDGTRHRAFFPESGPQSSEQTTINLERRLTMPVLLDPNGAQSGVLVFRVPSDALRHVVVNHYVLSLEDTHGNEYVKEMVLLREVRAEVADDPQA